MTFTARVHENDLSENQKQFLVRNGFTETVWQCPCGACDAELVFEREFSSEEESDEFLFNEEGEFRF